MNQKVSQGFRYLYGGQPVIALENGDGIVKVLLFEEAKPWNSLVMTVQATQLTPQPSRYLHGAIPQ